jgi:hypothetical protein
MNDFWEFTIAGYVVVLGGLALYTGWVLRRGRRLSGQVEPGRRRFLD